MRRRNGSKDADCYMFDEIWHYEIFEIGAGNAVEVSQVVLAVVVLLLGLVLSALLSSVVGHRLRKREVNATAAEIAQRVIFYTLLVATAFTALTLMQIPLTMFAFLGGAVAIGVGFGAQNIINNFISGWILIAERPIRIGDVVEVGGELGRVEKIGGRCSRIRRTDGIDMLVPNSQLLENTVVNWMLVDRNVRTSVRGVRFADRAGCGTDPAGGGGAGRHPPRPGTRHYL